MECVELCELWVFVCGQGRSWVRDAPVLVFHEVEDIATAPNEENLHEEIVQRDPFAGKDVKVSGNENGDVERLCLERDTCIQPRNPHLYRCE